MSKEGWLKALEVHKGRSVALKCFSMERKGGEKRSRTDNIECIGEGNRRGRREQGEDAEDKEMMQRTRRGYREQG